MKRQMLFFTMTVSVFFLFSGCGGEKAEIFKPGVIGEHEADPEVWGRIFPLHYESWGKTSEPKPSGKSMYRKGWDTDKVTYDKLSEFPFLGLLFHGWGFGIEYNEPRGHHFSVIDQIEIDPSRTGPGGVCLACKSPFHKAMVEKKGMKYLKAKFSDALDMYPEKLRELGPACIDCHNPSDMGLRTNKAHIEKGLKAIGKTELSRQEKRMLTCAQCHVTYYVPRDENKKVAGDIELPWTGSGWGDITIEKIARDLMKNYRRLEWKQKVTGFDMPFIRHPEFEMFTKGSVHFNAGLSCPDCHMPYRRMGSYKISTHDVTSPVKQDFAACSQCHTEEADWLKKQVFTIQERTLSLLNRAGYANAAAAKLFEKVHALKNKKSIAGSKRYMRARKYYMEGFLRLNFVGAENSMGFHNSTEAARVLADSVAYSNRAESQLRQILVQAGKDVPEMIQLDLGKYLNNRGKKKLKFRPEQEFRDPYGTQNDFTDRKSMGL